MISVVITTFGRPDYLKDAIESICKGTYKDYEIIIVDDNGEGNAFSNQTEKVVEKFKYLNLKYIKHKENYGANRARNTGIELSKNEYIAFLDDDDIFYNDKLDEVVKILKINKNIDLVYSGSNHKDESSNRVKYRFENVKDYKNKILKFNFIGSNSFVILKKEKLKELNGFDETLDSCQDWDMWIRFIFSGAKILGIDKPLVEYRVHNSKNRISKNREKRINGHKKLFKKIEVYLTQLSKEEQVEIKAYHEKRIADIEYTSENIKEYREIIKKIRGQIKLSLRDRIKYYLSRINIVIIGGRLKYQKH